MFWGEQIDDGQYNRFGKGSFDNIQTLQMPGKWLNYPLKMIWMLIQV